jgi:hypothetical protein
MTDQEFYISLHEQRRQNHACGIVDDKDLDKLIKDTFQRLQGKVRQIDSLKVRLDQIEQDVIGLKNARVLRR